MSRAVQEKSERIMKSALALLAKKGYENTTINDMADSAKVSRGLLHYYFKDKEDLVSKALTYGFGSMWEDSIASLAGASTAEELADGMIDVLKKNIQQNPDFSALLFEMWVSGRRSGKIAKVFGDGLDNTVDELKKLLELASSAGIIKIDPADSEGIVRILLAMYHGLAIQLLTNPEKLKDKKLWAPVRRLLLMAFGERK
ncbi:MAG TPA: TetR/AcrR family transcriptional regulator [Nitrososphaera sp.]|nr:TetR/AcrR family transcriptional regulator [Nitrososphaera sp.]